MYRNQFISHLPRDESDGLNPFGIIHCPGCELSWVLGFVPKHCPRCGTKVTDNPSQSRENLDKHLRQANLGIAFSKCLFCKKIIGGEPEIWQNLCPYCSGELKLLKKGKRSVTNRLKKFAMSILRK